MARIGVFGGTFNPPHVGHLSAAQFTAKALGLDLLLLIPDRDAPHKKIPQGSPTPQDRLEMLRLAARNMEKTQVCDLELNREGPSYTFETLQELKALYPGDELYLLMGSDMFCSLLTWRHPEIICSLSNPVVMCRGEKGEAEAIEAAMPGIRALGCAPQMVPNDPVEISSSDLRRMLVFDCAQTYLDPGVLDYIHDHGFYGAWENYKNLPMEELERVVVSLLKPNRVAHVLGCRDTAVILARRFGADETEAARAGLLHDVTKALGPEQQLALCRSYGIELKGFAAYNPKVLHQITGAAVARKIFGENEAVCQAIDRHTTGCAGMTTLDKIIYIADYMEPNRKIPGVEALRRLTESDLDAAVALGLHMTIDVLREQGREVCPDSLAALRELTKEDEIV